jgi:hypothetical protein
MIKIIVILSIMAGVLVIVGGGFFSIVQIRQNKLNKGYFINSFKDLTVADKKLMIIGAILTCLGILIIVILRIVWTAPLWLDRLG